MSNCKLCNINTKETQKLGKTTKIECVNESCTAIHCGKCFAKELPSECSECDVIYDVGFLFDSLNHIRLRDALSKQLGRLEDIVDRKIKEGVEPPVIEPTDLSMDRLKELNDTTGKTWLSRIIRDGELRFEVTDKVFGKANTEDQVTDILAHIFTHPAFIKHAGRIVTGAYVDVPMPFFSRNKSDKGRFESKETLLRAGLFKILGGDQIRRDLEESIIDMYENDNVDLNLMKDMAHWFAGPWF